MRKLIVFEWVSLDGIFDAQSMNNWYFPYDSEERQQYISKCIHDCDAMLMGRKTYEMLAPYWSAMKNNEMGVAGKLNSTTKYVVSATLQTADWSNSILIKENVTDAISKLKQQPGKEILVQGSGALLASLAAAGLVDEYRLLVHPAIVGNGKRLFPEGMPATGLRLVNTQSLSQGVMLLCYQPVK